MSKRKQNHSEFKANVERHDGLRARPPEAAMRHDPANGAIVIMLRSLMMHGMAQAVTDLSGCIA